MRWIGEHSDNEDLGRTPGMLGHISLTVVRDMPVQDFLATLGTEPLGGRTYENRPPTYDGSMAMYGTGNGWGYILEDRDCATVHQVQYATPPIQSAADIEAIALTMKDWDPPRLILTSPQGQEGFKSAEFAEATAGQLPGLDEALNIAGAVFPSIHTAGEDEVSEYFEEHYAKLAPAVFHALAAYTGLVIDRAQVEAGTLPLALIPAPSRQL